MANYYSPTIIQPTILLAAMTPLERLVLSHVFSAEADGDGLYFYAEETPADMLTLSRAELAAALAEAGGRSSAIHAYAAKQLAQVPSGQSEIDLDLTAGIGWEDIVQGIIRRSPTLRYATAVSAFTCSRMRADGFGGMAVLITADAIRAKSTTDLIEEFFADAGLADALD